LRFGWAGWNEWTEGAEEELKTGILGTRIHFDRLVPQCTGYSAHGQPVSGVVPLPHAGASRMFQPNLWEDQQHQVRTTGVET
jgi:hypothetical protein